jgi:phosphatidylglycerol:prolipoprotein diacylglycerol transferase
VRDFFSVADLIAPGIILAQAIGRVGCLINGCCWGKPAADWLPWSVVYTHPNSYAPLNIPLHPTQVYEIIFALVCFVILLRLTGRLKPAGSVFLVYFIMYSAWRIGIGFWRYADVYFAFGLSQAQILSIVVLAASVFILIYRRYRFREEEKSSG